MTFISKTGVWGQTKDRLSVVKGTYTSHATKGLLKVYDRFVMRNMRSIKKRAKWETERVSRRSHKKCYTLFLFFNRHFSDRLSNTYTLIEDIGLIGKGYCAP